MIQDDKVSYVTPQILSLHIFDIQQKNHPRFKSFQVSMDRSMVCE